MTHTDLWKKVKENLKSLARQRDEGRYRILIMLDYIYYQYNSHEYNSALEFGQKLDFMVSRRPGNLFKLSEEHPELARHEKPQEQSVGLPVQDLCDWPWKVMTIDWNGNIFPCCDYVVWNDQQPSATFEPGKDNIKEIWNGPAITTNRTVHLTKGRGGYEICSKCTRTGTAFKF